MRPENTDPDERNQVPAASGQPYEVTHFRLDQFAAHQFLQTLRRHSGQHRRMDATAEIPRPHFASKSS